MLKDTSIADLLFPTLTFGEFDLIHNRLNPGSYEKSPFKIKLTNLGDTPIHELGIFISNFIRQNMNTPTGFIIGVPTSATKLASICFSNLKNHWKDLELITASKQDDKTIIINSPPQEFSSVICLDDVLTWGFSKRNIKDALTAKGFNLEKIIIVIDREQGGRQVLESMGLEVYSLFTIHELLDYYYEESMVSYEVWKKVLNYCHDHQAQTASL